MAERTNRRSFLKSSAMAGAGFWVASRHAAAQSRSPNEKIRVAAIGTGGKGGGDTDDAGRLGEVVAVCDVRESALRDKANKYSKAKAFKDFREMFDRMEKDIDAVTVSTPDHTHAVAAMWAMMRGKHVFVQKPLCHDAYEARMLTQAAKHYKVCTQMGNQGTAEDGLRKAVEVVWSGMIGAVKEVHVWTNRPVWPQGASAVLNLPAVQAAITGKGDPKTDPKDVDWDLWLGTAPERPFQPNYQPFNWRGWWDWGTGALGDMACHTANMAFMACQLGSPISLEAEVSEFNPQSFPMWSVVRYEFPERRGRNGTLPPLKWTWYDGGNDKPAWVGRKLKELAHGRDIPGSGSLIIGEKATLFSPNDYGSDWALLPEGTPRDQVKVDQILPRAHGRHMEEWFQAMRENKPSIAVSNFAYAGPLTETVVLGCIAQRFANRRLEWDGPSMTFKNFKEANQFVKREYREGWELPELPWDVMASRG